VKTRVSLCFAEGFGTGALVIAIHANSFRTVRGRTLLACIFDEIAFWRDETSATPAAYFDKRTYTLTMTGLSELSDASASIEYFDCY
jgi:hypothetical protein